MLRRRGGFTLIELLVVLAIIGILVGLLFPALSLLRNRQKRLSTLNVMNALSMALTTYLETYPLIGNSTSSDFVAAPYRMLHLVPLETKKPIFIELRASQVSVGPIGGPYAEPQLMRLGEHILDAWGVPGRANRLQWAIINKPPPSGGATNTYTDRIYIRSTAGTPQVSKDDLILRMLVVDGRWEAKTWQEAVDEAAAATPPIVLPPLFQ